MKKVWIAYALLAVGLLVAPFAVGVMGQSWVRILDFCLLYAMLAAYLLAPGRFSDELQLAGADAVSRPIGVHHLLVDLIEQRWRSAIAESLVVSRPKAVND